MRWLGWIIAAALGWCLWRHYQASAAATAPAGRMKPRYRRMGPLVNPAPTTMGKLIPFGPNSTTGEGSDCGCGK